MPSVLFRPEDILISIFYFFPKSEFPADRQLLHTAFYELSRKDPELLNEFTFNTDKLFPTSEELDQALNNLEFSRYLRKFNPHLDHYQIEEVNNSYFKSKLEKEFSGYESRIKELSEILQAYLLQ